MKIFVAIFLFVHGFAHLIGFVVPWKIAHLEEMPYKTTVFNGNLYLGEFGIRIVGIFWLIIALAFSLSSYLLITHNPIWLIFTLVITLVSIILCILGWPDSKIGVFVNFFIVLGIFILQWFDWIVLD
ncbi:MAG: hypothetical protein KAS18_00605 [Calditrichia bacterium]|nr:hypothetical protein [Calditrichia bacterium]